MGRLDPLGDGIVTDRDPVTALLADPGYAGLLARVRARLERGGDPATMRLHGLEPAERAVLSDLLSSSRRVDADVTVRVEALDAALRGSRVGLGLVELLERTGGPLSDRRAERAAIAAAWADVWAWLDGEVADRPGLAGWAAHLRTGVLSRLVADETTGRMLLDAALSVLDQLPADGQSLARLAATTTGDPHALDAGRPLGTITLAGVACMVAGLAAQPVDARERREWWDRVGVVCDPLSVSVLVLGLRANGTGPVTDAVTGHARAGEPLRLTLRAVRDGRLQLMGEPVHVCENPAVVVAAAERLGAACRPLICVEGVPNTAADDLLRSVAAAGGEIRVHADFDGGGVRIMNLLVARHGGVPWRFGARDYLAAVSKLATTVELDGRVDDTPWDPDLAVELREHRRVVYEEQVLDDLLAELQR